MSDAQLKKPITDAHRDTFRHRGVVRLSGLIPDELVAPARERLRQFLQRGGFCRDGVWIAGRDAAQTAGLVKRIRAHTKATPEFAALGTARVQHAAECLMGGRSLVASTSRMQILFTPPDATEWEVPHKIWHVDVPRLGDLGCPGVQAFAFLDRVDPGGGGTVVAAGSHRFVNDVGRVRSKDVKKRLRRADPWFETLLRPDGLDRRRFLDVATPCGDAELQVVELTGAPGDVWLTDLRVLHSLAPNTANRPRMMVTQRYFLPEVAQAAYTPE